MTARLPTPGGDAGTWGTVLNDYLSVSINTDGTLKSSAVSTAGAEVTSNKDTDGTLAANSDTKYPSQKAVKTYADTKQAALGYTAENAANKDTDGTLAANSDTKYPSQKAVVTYAQKRISTGTPRYSGGSVRDYRILGEALITGVTTGVASTNRWTFEPYIVREPIVLDRVAMEVTTAGAAGKLARIALYTANDYWQPASLVQDFGTVAVDPGVVPSIAAITIPSLTINPGRYLGVWITDGGATYRIVNAYSFALNAINNAASASSLRSAFQSLNGSGTVASGFASVSPAWERNLYAATNTAQFYLRWREVA